MKTELNYIPTATDINNLNVGDLAPNVFGDFREVTEILYKGVDIHGKAFCGYYVKWGSNPESTSRISHSIKEGQMLAEETLSNNKVTA